MGVKMFLLKSSLRTIPISQCRRQLSITSVEKNRGPTTLEEIKFARAKVRIHVYLQGVSKKTPVYV